MGTLGSVPASNAVPAGQRVRDLLNTAFSGEVPVLYGYPGRDIKRESVWIGKATATHEGLTFRNNGPRPRRESLILEVHVEVTVPGGTPEDAAARLADLGAVIEVTIAANSTLADLPGCKDASVHGIEHEAGWRDDESAGCQATYQLAVESVLQ